MHAAIRRHTGRFNIRNERFFDLEGKHCNIQPKRDWRTTVRYVEKDGDFKRSTNFEDLNFTRNSQSTTHWREAMLAESRTEFLDIIRQNYPREYILCNNQINNFAERHYSRRKTYTSLYDAQSFSLCQSLRDWLSGCFIRPRNARPRTLYLIGGSRLGKTEWARSLGDHIYCNGYINVKDILDGGESDYIVVDDVPFDRFIGFKSIVGCQNQFTLTDKYMKKVTITGWNKPCIILLNPDMNYYNKMDIELQLWFQDNTIRVSINEPLF